MSTPSKRWIKPGMDVVHKATQRKMVVMQIFAKHCKDQYGQQRRFVEGVHCRWVDASGELRSDIFHTKELVRDE